MEPNPAPIPGVPPDHCDTHIAYHKFCSLCGTAKREHDAAVEALALGQEQKVDANEHVGAGGSTAEDLSDEKTDKPKRSRRR